MKLKELLKELKKYNKEAEVNIVANFKTYSFTITWGGGDEISKEFCEEINFYVDKLNSSEQAK